MARKKSNKTKTKKENNEDIEFVKDDSQLDRLEAAMAEQQKNHVEELAESVADSDEQKKELEKQIEEDLALQKEMEAQGDDDLENDPELQAALPQADADGNLDLEELQSCIECFLFMADKPMSVKKLKELLGPEYDTKLFKQALKALQEAYQSPRHGIELAQIAGGYQLRTKPGRAALARKLAKTQKQRLSRGAMETLAIISYKQPVMKDDIDKIRGVDSTHFIRGLLDRNLVQISGRSELPGRPMLYTTTNQFLEIFGLNSLEDMPPLREVEKMIPASETDRPEDPAVTKMREMVVEMKKDKHRIKYDPKEDEKFLKDIRDKVKNIPTSTPFLHALDNPEAETPAESAAGADAPAGAEAAGDAEVVLQPELADAVAEVMDAQDATPEMTDTAGEPVLVEEATAPASSDTLEAVDETETVESAAEELPEEISLETEPSEPETTPETPTEN